VEGMDERRLTKEIYKADLDGNAVRERPKGKTTLMKSSKF
jgi:hypothetical protein